MSRALRELGLGPDADERAIKRAYAARLKTIRPETDPEAFQALNETYQAALEWLWQRSTPSKTPIPDSFTAFNAAPGKYASVKPHIEGTPISMLSIPSSRNDESADADFDEQDFFFDILEHAEKLNPEEFKHWLERNETLYSMPLKAALGEPLVWFLHDQPPLTREHLAVTLAFFGLDTVNDATIRLQEPLHQLHRTARRSDTDWEESISDTQHTGHSNAYRESSGSGSPIWLVIFLVFALARCVGSSST